MSTPSTSFRPKFNGFRFKNSDAEWEFFGVTGKLLCGGMSYSAIDYFLAKIGTPKETSAPALGTPLQDYLQSRQVTAHLNTSHRFLNHWITPPDRRPSMDEEFETVKSFIDKGQPIPICTAGVVGEGHHLAAFAYQGGDLWTIYAYDPNSPGKVAMVEKYMNGPDKHFIKNSESSKFWHSFFCDDGYEKKTPTVAGMIRPWYRCSKCQGLFFGGDDNSGKCPCGGAHDKAGSAEYSAWSPTGGESNWKWCCRCQGMYFAKRPGKCPAGAGHNGTFSSDYTLALNQGKGESGWLWCKVCEGLYYGASGSSVCPDGKKAHTAGDGAYLVRKF